MQAPGHRNSLIFEKRDIDLKIIKSYSFCETTV